MNTNVWLYGDHRAMRVGIGSDADRSDCRCYHVLTLNLLADKPCWRKLGGAGNYDYKHIPDAEAELRETLPEDAHELTEAEADALFMDRRSNMFTPRPEAVKVWDGIMHPSPKNKEKPMKKGNDRCPLQDECERTCKVVGHERDCDYYVNNRVGCDGIPDQDEILDAEELEQNRAWEEAQIAAEPDEDEYASTCPYFVGMTEPDEDGKRKLLCKTRAQPYTGALYGCGCADWDAKGSNCRLYWLQKIKDEIGDVPPLVEQGSVKDMQDFYDQEKAHIANPTEAAPACPADVGAAAQSLSAAGTASLADGPAFEYNGLDEETAYELQGITQCVAELQKNYAWGMAYQVGRAHELLCGTEGACKTVLQAKRNNQHSEATFTAWCQYIGVTRQTAYNLLNAYRLISGATPEQQTILQQAPARLLYEAGKTDAPQELASGVKGGDITSHKQYQELLAQLEAEKTARAEAEQLYQRNEQLEEKNQQLNAALDQQGEYIARIHELETRPIDVAVAEPDPAEVERLAAEKAAAMTAELRGQLKTAENNIRQMHAHTESLEGQLEDWREAARRQTPLTFENVLPMARDLAGSVTALYNTFALAACELRGEDYTQCAAPLTDALQDALTSLRGAINEHSANTYKEDEDFE